MGPCPGKALSACLSLYLSVCVCLSLSHWLSEYCLLQEGCWDVLLCPLGPCLGKAVPLCVCLYPCLCLSLCLSVVHLKRAASALWASALDRQTYRQTHTGTHSPHHQHMVSRVDMVMAALACVCLCLSVHDFLSLVLPESRTLKLMVCVSESRS